MAIRSFNSVGGFSVAETPVEVISNVGNVTAFNLTVTELSDLGAIGNVTITGGTTGQGIITDGAGTLSFGSTGLAANTAAVMPYIINASESYQVGANLQGLFSQPIEIDGELDVEGILIEVGVSQNAESSQIYFDNSGTFYGNTGFTFNINSGNLDVPGNVNATGSMIPSANVIYDLGTNTSRWRDLYLSGTSIFLGGGSLAEAANGAMVMTNGDGGQFIFDGSQDFDHTGIFNTTSNVSIDSAGASVTMGVGGQADVFTMASTGVLTTTGNVVPLGIKTDGYFYANGVAVTFGSTAAGSDTQVQFNDGGTDFGATTGLTFNKTSGLLTASGNTAGNNFISTSGTVRFGTGGGAGVISVDTGTTTAGVFTTTMTDVNIGLNANVVICGTGKTLTARGNVSATNINSTTLSVEDFYSSRTAVSVGSTNTTIDSFPAATYRSAKYTMKVSDNTGYQALEVLLVHDGVTPIMTVYGSLSTTGADLVTLTTVLSGSNILLRASPVNTSTSVNLMGTYVPD
mgnify:CR=1 FL=1|jgi:hypothetical protein|tara:strand:+ start:325 stop:1872 length:1548 start_codon:yes stop_codon:yes gene_type:complete